MLEAAHERRKEGVGVVVGWVDTHGRAETEALLEDSRCCHAVRWRIVVRP